MQLLGRDQLAGEEQLAGLVPADQQRQLRAGPEQADVDLGGAERGALGGEQDVAHRGQRQARADGRSVDRADHRHRAAADRPERLPGDEATVELRARRTGGAVAVDGPQVRTAHERPRARAREDGDPHVAVLTERPERVADGRQRLRVDRVDRRAVDGDGRDVVGGLDPDRGLGLRPSAARIRPGGVVLRSGFLGGGLKFAGGCQPLLPMISMTSAMFSTSSS